MGVTCYCEQLAVRFCILPCKHKWTAGVQRYVSITSAVDGVGGQCHAPAALPPGKKHCIHCRRGWVGPSNSLDGYRKCRPPPGFNSRTFQSVTPTSFSRPPVSRVHVPCCLVRRPIPVTGLCVSVRHLILTASRRHLVTDVETNCRTANQDTSQNQETVLSSAGNDSSVGMVTRL